MDEDGGFVGMLSRLKAAEAVCEALSLGDFMSGEARAALEKWRALAARGQKNENDEPVV